MSNVVNLNDYRKPRAADAVKKHPCPAGVRYFCMTCDTGGFNLYADGSVFCRNCGTLIRNLTVRE